jgi:hypothetical protein
MVELTLKLTGKKMTLTMTLPYAKFVIHPSPLRLPRPSADNPLRWSSCRYQARSALVKRRYQARPHVAQAAFVDLVQHHIDRQYPALLM